MKKILVSGGAGFIGSHLCRVLLEKNSHVICLDNLSTGSIDNIQSLINEHNFEFLQNDVMHPLDIKVDEIYHLACPASPKSYSQDPINTNRTSVLGSINMLELAKNNKAKILFTSTSEIYGDPEIHPQVESYRGNVNVTGPRSCYVEGKRCAETFFYDYHRQYGLDTKVVRVFNTYGPKMQLDDGRVISNFIVQALLNKEVSIYGTGGQTRSFCYIDDLVKGIISFMNTETSPLCPMNLGNDEEISISELAKIILQKTGSNSKLSFKPLPQDDPYRRRPALSYAKRLIHWQPKYSLDQGLNETIEYFKGQLNKI